WTSSVKFDPSCSALPACHNTPILGSVVDRCALAASGHTVAPPKSAMNSRRPMPNIGLPPVASVPPLVGLSRAELAAGRSANPWVKLNCSESRSPASPAVPRGSTARLRQVPAAQQDFDPAGVGSVPRPGSALFDHLVCSCQERERQGQA